MNEKQITGPADIHVVQDLIDFVVENVGKTEWAKNSLSNDVVSGLLPELMPMLMQHLNENADGLSRLGGHGHFHPGFSDTAVRNYHDGYSGLDEKANEQQKTAAGLRSSVSALYGAELNRIFSMGSAVTRRDGTKFTVDPGTPLPEYLQRAIKQGLDRYLISQESAPTLNK